MFLFVYKEYIGTHTTSIALYQELYNLHWYSYTFHPAPHRPNLVLVDDVPDWTVIN